VKSRFQCVRVFFRPAGALCVSPAFSHRLRRGLHSNAASRLGISVVRLDTRFVEGYNSQPCRHAAIRFGPRRELTLFSRDSISP